MGAGKTSVGRCLAQRLNWAFEDLDDRVVAREGRSIADIFRESGEPAFRRAESSALRQVLKESAAGAAKVIALGGGAFAQKENASALKKSGLPGIFLDADVKELWQRCSLQAASSGTERPLLKTMEQFQQLYESRRKAYLRASLRIDTGGRAVTEIAEEIILSFGLSKLAIRNQEGEVE